MACRSSFHWGKASRGPDPAAGRSDVSAPNVGEESLSIPSQVAGADALPRGFSGRRPARSRVAPALASAEREEPDDGRGGGALDEALKPWVALVAADEAPGNDDEEQRGQEHA